MAYNGKLGTYFRLSQRLYSKLHSGRQVRNWTASNAGSRNVGFATASKKQMWFTNMTIFAAGTGLCVMAIKKCSLTPEGPEVYSMSCEGKADKEDDNNGQSLDESQGKLQQFGKIVSDPVHGTIQLDPIAIKVIDTKEFQRLRWIKQLGECEYVYPGATHSRFSHSIGVYHLTCEMLQALKEDGQRRGLPDDVLLTKKEEQTLKIAALCHDLGHGPFSHLYEDFMSSVKEDTDPEGQGNKWSHEDISVRVIGKICRDAQIEDQVDVNLFEHLLQGLTLEEFKKEYGHTDRKKKAYMFQIVSNKETSIDVDKWDYFRRDSMACGVPERFSFERALQVAKIVQTDPDVYELCYREKDALNMYNMFNTRYTLYKCVAYHPVSGATQMMIKDAMLLANREDSYFRRRYGMDLAPIRDSKKAEDVDRNLYKYMKLTDSVLELMDMDDEGEGKRMNAGDKQMKDILSRLKHRDIYKMVFQSKKIYDDSEEAKTAEKNYQEIFDKRGISKDTAEIKLVNVGYWSKNRDPVEYLKFYHKGNPDQGKPKPRQEVSELLPVRFSETIVRVYSKLPKNSKKESLDEALKEIRKCEKEEIEKEKKKNIRIKELLKDAQLELRKNKASDGGPGKTKEKYDGDN